MNLSTEITAKDVLVPVRGFQYFRARATRKMRQLSRDLNQYADHVALGGIDGDYVGKILSQINYIKTKINLVKYVYQPMACVAGAAVVGYGAYKGLESIFN